MQRPKRKIYCLAYHLFLIYCTSSRIDVLAESYVHITSIHQVCVVHVIFSSFLVFSQSNSSYPTHPSLSTSKCMTSTASYITFYSRGLEFQMLSIYVWYNNVRRSKEISTTIKKAMHSIGRTQFVTLFAMYINKVMAFKID